MNEIDITSIEGFFIGSAQHRAAGTGCTVILSPQGAVAGVDVRGAAPGTRETDLLRSENSVEQIHAVLLAGGSAFGLDAASGIASFLEEKQIGFDAGVAKVPIIPGAVLFDLGVGNGQIRPDKKMGYEAAQSAWTEPGFREGNVGAGTGASVGKCLGADFSMKSGIGSYAVQIGDLKIGAVVAVNAFGDIIDPDSNRVIAGVYDRQKKALIDSETHILQLAKQGNKTGFSENTIIGSVITNAKVTKAKANKIASISHDGLARTTKPSHTFVDGDCMFVMAGGEVKEDLNVLGMLAVQVVEKAIIRAVLKAETAYGLPCTKTVRKS